MTYEEQEKAIELKWQIIDEQGKKCSVCGKLFQRRPEIAHRIPKHKKWLKKYGSEIIHHRLNLTATCKNCNSMVLVNPESLPGQALIKEIREAINENSD